MSSQPKLKVTARKNLDAIDRISLGDIFQNIEIIEKVSEDESLLSVSKIVFPYVICLNQECDLEQDFYMEKRDQQPALLHLLVAPVFNFESFLVDKHWGEIYIQHATAISRDKTSGKVIMNNENPRYHYIHFSEESDLPELVVDFKYFFTINRDYLYANKDHRICSMDALFREKINQRFSFFLSRIGLPDSGECSVDGRDGSGRC